MVKKLKVFKSTAFGEIRVLEIYDEIYFVGKDVAEKLGYSNISDALIKHVDEDDKKQIAFNDLKELGFIDVGTKGTPIINESGLYSLILRSKLPNAKGFKRWVTNDILPSIRKTGTYNMVNSQSNDSYLIENPIERAKRWIEEQEANQLKIQEKDKVIQLQQPKVLFADAVLGSENSILVGELAKILKQNGVDTGQNRLFDWLRDNGYLIKRKGEDYNIPTQKSMNLGIMEVKKRVINNPDGSTKVTRTVKITGKGQVYFINKLKSDNKIKLVF
ncbi:phage antirepressor [Clostridioides difficile]|uniref:phage antirepressor n=1 Tax=Clostridioides difficile TaxID=1496 RepID=UPI003F8D36D2